MNEKKRTYNIVPITDQDRHSVMNLLKTYFFHDEPLNASIALIEETESVIKLENFCDTYLQNGEFFIIVQTIFTSNAYESFFYIIFEEFKRQKCLT